MGKGKVSRSPQTERAEQSEKPYDVDLQLEKADVSTCSSYGERCKPRLTLMIVVSRINLSQVIEARGHTPTGLLKSASMRSEARRRAGLDE